jgi:hypothetical protein
MLSVSGDEFDDADAEVGVPTNRESVPDVTSLLDVDVDALSGPLPW